MNELFDLNWMALIKLSSQVQARNNQVPCLKPAVLNIYLFETVCHLDTAPDGDGEGDEDEEVGDKGDDAGHTAVVLQI